MRFIWREMQLRKAPSAFLGVCAEWRVLLCSPQRLFRSHSQFRPREENVVTLQALCRLLLPVVIRRSSKSCRSGGHSALSLAQEVISFELIRSLDSNSRLNVHENPDLSLSAVPLTSVSITVCRYGSSVRPNLCIGFSAAFYE